MYDDLISRQAAIDALICKMGPHDNGDGTMTIYVMSERLVRETLNDLPPAQPEIIRCKDCRFNTYSKKCLNSDSFFLVPADDFFCGYAERRTDE